MDQISHWNRCIFILILVIRLASCEVTDKITLCGYPGNHKFSYSNVTAKLSEPGTVAEYKCDAGYLLVGPSFRRCNNQGNWHPKERPFCMVNVAAQRRVFNVSKPIDNKSENKGSSVTDDSITTCSKADGRFAYDNYSWTIDLMEIQKVDAVQLYFSKIPDAPITLYSGIHEYDLKIIDPSEYEHLDISHTDKNPTDTMEVREKIFHKTKEMRFFRIVIARDSKKLKVLSLCEVKLLSKSAISKTRCSGTTEFTKQDIYNGICYTIEYSPQTWRVSNSLCQKNYDGFLVSNISKEKNAFLKQHIQNPTVNERAHYWIGGYRNGAEEEYHDYEEDPYGRNRNSKPDQWYWIRNNQTIEEFFWDPAHVSEERSNCIKIQNNNDLNWGNDNCAISHYYICEHEPVLCGRPDKDDYSYLTSEELNFTVGEELSYHCQEGYVLEGESKRICEKIGQWSGTVPNCNLKAKQIAHHNRLSAGEIVAIVLGSLAALILIIVIIVLICKKRRSGSQKIQYNKEADSAEALNVTRDNAGRSNYTAREDHKK